MHFVVRNENIRAIIYNREVRDELVGSDEHASAISVTRLASSVDKQIPGTEEAC